MKRGRTYGSEPRVVRLGLDLVELCHGFERRLLRRGLVALNAQMQDSAVSALSNVGEGWDEISPGDKRRFLRYALRSAGECQRQLEAAARVEALPPAELDHALRLTRALKLDVLRLIRWCDTQLTP